MGVLSFLSTQILDASASGVSVLTGTPAQGRTALELGTMAVADTASYAAIAGATFQGQLVTTASVTGGAGFVLTPGATPTSLVNGAIWTLDGTTSLYARLLNTTYQFSFFNRAQTWTVAQTFASGIVGSGDDLHIRSGTTPQAISVYKTYTSATNNEHLHIGAESGYFGILSTVGSTGGTLQPIKIGHTNSSGTTTAALDIGIDSKTTITVHDQVGLIYSPSGGTTATLLLAAAGSNVHTVNRPTSGNITLALSGDTNAQRFLILLTTSGSGTPGTVTWFSGITWLTNGGVAPTLATGNSKTDSVVLQRSGSGTYFGWHTGVNA